MINSELIDMAKNFGVPLTILFWVLFISGQNQRDLVNEMKGIQKALTSLTISVHDAISFMKGRGGD